MRARIGVPLVRNLEAADLATRAATIPTAKALPMAMPEVYGWSLSTLGPTLRDVSLVSGHRERAPR
jgi:hypothetical protein